VCYLVPTADGKALLCRYNYLSNIYTESQYFFSRRYVGSDDRFNEWWGLLGFAKLYRGEV